MKFVVHQINKHFPTNKQTPTQLIDLPTGLNMSKLVIVSTSPDHHSQLTTLYNPPIINNN